MKNDSPSKSPDKKVPQVGNNLVWYLLALGVGILVVVTWMNPKQSVNIPYGRLEQLIKQKSPQQNPDAAIVLDEGTEGNRQRVQYSNLRELVVGQAEIVGKVDRKVLKGATNEPIKTVEFSTARLGFENDNGRLNDLLAKNGFEDFSGEHAPSALRNYLPMLIVTLIFVAVFFVMMRRLGGAGSPMAFGRSRGKMYAQEDVGITFDDAGAFSAVAVPVAAWPRSSSAARDQSSSAARAASGSRIRCPTRGARRAPTRSRRSSTSSC